MRLQVAGHQTEKYTVATEVYEGPLDLLLELIERAELDITRLALAQVTDQYLEYLRHLEEQNAAEVSAFLVIAARLLQIKSAALLPRLPAELSFVDEEDAGEALARQLMLYKRFKELAGYLQRREEAGLRTYLRVAPPPKITIQVHLDLTGVGLTELAAAARDVFFNKPALSSLNQVVTLPRITIAEKIQNIIDRLRSVRLTTFRSMLSPGTSRIEVVVTFLALLELVKRRIVAAQQNNLFADIQVEPAMSLPSQGDMDEIDWDDDSQEFEGQ